MYKQTTDVTAVTSVVLKYLIDISFIVYHRVALRHLTVWFFLLVSLLLDFLLALYHLFFAVVFEQVFVVVRNVVGCAVDDADVALHNVSVHAAK